MTKEHKGQNEMLIYAPLCLRVCDVLTVCVSTGSTTFHSVNGRLTLTWMDQMETELIQIHSKLLMADDRTVIIGHRGEIEEVLDTGVRNDSTGEQYVKEEERKKVHCEVFLQET